MFPQLETNRFFLKKVDPEDLPFLYEGLGDREIMPYNGIYFDSLEETKKQLEWYDKNWNDGSGISWKIVDKTTGEKCGVISVYYYKPEHKKAELGYWLLPKCWGKGITLEVLQHVIDYWLNEKDLHRMEAYVEDENIASIRIMERAGFVYEGTMRDCEIKFGRYISLRIYSLLNP